MAPQWYDHCMSSTRLLPISAAEKSEPYSAEHRCAGEGNDGDMRRLERYPCEAYVVERESLSKSVVGGSEE